MARGGDAESVMVAARKMADEHVIKGEPEIRVLNLGEGLGSIAKAVLKKYPSARVVGVDRRGFTWTGFERWYISHHGGGAPRLVTKELGGGQRLVLGSLQESVSPGNGVGRDRLGTGVYPLQRGEQPEHHQGVRPRQAWRETMQRA